MKNILIIDDESDILLGFKKSLENGETRVDIAETLDQAKDYIDSNGYFCVITDLRLSGALREGGFEVLRYVRSKDPSPYVIVITGHGNAATMQEAYSLGANEYFEKPVSVEMLRNSLSKFEQQRLEKMAEHLTNHLRIESKNGLRTIYFTGGLTIVKAEPIRAALLEILPGAQALVFNVESLSEVDVAGLQVLCAAHKTCARLNIGLSIDSNRSSAFVNAVREAGFSRHAGCIRERSTDCLWCEDGQA